MGDWENNLNHYQEIVFYATGPKFGMCPQSSNKGKEPLWEGCVHSKLSLAVTILSTNLERNQS